MELVGYSGPLCFVSLRIDIEFVSSGSASRQCSECELVLPSNKLGLIKHMAVEHELVMTFVERDKTREMSLDKALESVCNIALPGEDEIQPGAGDDGEDMKGVGGGNEG